MRNLDERLNSHPHYKDDRFKEPQTIFGEYESGLRYDYSDRLWGWSWTKARRAADIANESGAEPNTARWFQTFLSEYWERDVEIRHIMAGWNLSTAFPYQVLGYRFVDDEEGSDDTEN